VQVSSDQRHDGSNLISSPIDGGANLVECHPIGATLQHKPLALDARNEGKYNSDHQQVMNPGRDGLNFNSHKPGTLPGSQQEQKQLQDSEESSPEIKLNRCECSKLQQIERD